MEGSGPYQLLPLEVRVALLFLKDSAYAQRDSNCSVLPVKQQQQLKELIQFREFALISLTSVPIRMLQFLS